MNIDMVLDLDRGDCAKSKVACHLLKNNKYDLCLKTNGSSNAGHTSYHTGVKFVTHLLSAGIFFNVKTIIGVNCVLNPGLFFEEINSLQEKFKQVKSLSHINLHEIVKIDQNAFIVEDEHIKEDIETDKIGSTHKGVAQAYRDKYARTARQAKNIKEFEPYLTDLYEEIKNNDRNIICEGSQSFYLDPHHTNDYPYCTSSHCTVGGMLINGLPYSAIRWCYGVIKCYSTFVGNLKFHGDDPIFNIIQDIGQEIGSTTGRKRQCNWLNIDEFKKAAFTNSITHLVINKMDILQQLNVWKVRFNDGIILDLKTEDNFKNYIQEITSQLPVKPQVFFSYSKEEI